MRGETGFDKFMNWLFVDRIPVTKLIIISNVLAFLLMALFRPVSGALGLLAFSSDWVMAQPWTVFTYPLIGVGGNPINMLFAGYWMWVAGGSLERAWGTRTFILYFFGMCAISAVGLLIGGMVSGVGTSAVGLWLPLAGVTVAFAMMNPEQQILFFFIIPLKLKYLALLDVVLVLVAYSQSGLLLGVFALAGCAFSYWYVRRGRSISYRSPRPTTRSNNVVRLYRKPSPLSKLNPLRWIKDYREKKRLRRLLGR